MAIRSDSYSSVDAVAALNRQYLQGQTTFNTTTTPTASQVESFIDEASGLVNLALWKHGFDPSDVTANSTTKLVCDNWVRNRAATYVSMVYGNQGYGGDNQSQTDFLDSLLGAADKLVMTNVLGFKHAGVSATVKTSRGLAFTGLTAQEDRDDPDNSDYEQPKFSRGQFDNE